LISFFHILPLWRQLHLIRQESLLLPAAFPNAPKPHGLGLEGFLRQPDISGIVLDEK
jgi:hypothetical protein